MSTCADGGVSMHGLPTLSEAAQIPLHCHDSRRNCGLGHSQVIGGLLHSISRCKGKDGSNRKQQLGLLTGDGSEHTWAPAVVGFDHVFRCLAVQRNEPRGEGKTARRCGRVDLLL